MAISPEQWQPRPYRGRRPSSYANHGPASPGPATRRVLKKMAAKIQRRDWRRIVADAAFEEAGGPPHSTWGNF